MEMRDYINSFSENSDRFYTFEAFARSNQFPPWRFKDNHVRLKPHNGTIIFPRIISGELCRFCGARDPRWLPEFGIPETTLLIIGMGGQIVGSIVNIGKDS